MVMYSPISIPAEPCQRHFKIPEVQSAHLESPKTRLFEADYHTPQETYVYCKAYPLTLGLHEIELFEHPNTPEPSRDLFGEAAPCAGITWPPHEEGADAVY